MKKKKSSYLHIIEDNILHSQIFSYTSSKTSISFTQSIFLLIFHFNKYIHNKKIWWKIMKIFPTLEIFIYSILSFSLFEDFFYFLFVCVVVNISFFILQIFLFEKIMEENRKNWGESQRIYMNDLYLNQWL